MRILHKLISVSALLATTAMADPQVDYMLQCQGCHRADGGGMGHEVPDFNEFLTRFIAVPEGREFLVRVPGSANAPFSDQQLADVLNWIMTDLISEPPAGFEPYTAAEVHRYKATPLIEVSAARNKVLQLTE
jgi:mono/diheme cytochrome c family protein